MADQNKVQFTNGDPSDLEIKLGLKDLGFSEEDALSFFVARMLPQHFRENKEFGTSDSIFKKTIETDLIELHNRVKSDLNFGYQDFMNWLNRQSETPVSKLFSEQALAPLDSGSPIQKISFQVDILRNRSLLKRIENMVNTYDRVLVIYGSAHYLSLSPALESVLGVGKMEKPY